MTKPIELSVLRQPSIGDFTPGELLWEGTHQSYTCEDVIREIPGHPVSEWKIPDRTAIPSGRYQLTISYSPHFSTRMPLLLGVPGYVGVRIHPGNTARDTEGCILLGDTRTTSGVGDSRHAFTTFFERLDAACKETEVFLTVSNPNQSLRVPVVPTAS